MITIRLALTEDIDRLRDLIELSVRDLSQNYYSSQEIESALRHIFGVDTQLLRDQTYFVAESGTEIVGCGGWSKRKTLYGGDQAKSSEPEQLLDPNHDAARIRALYVHPDWARRGIARKILAACEAAAQAAGFKQLELVATLPGEPLYLASGYEKREAVNLNTPDGQALPAFLMVKTLP